MTDSLSVGPLVKSQDEQQRCKVANAALAAKEKEVRLLQQQLASLQQEGGTPPQQSLRPCLAEDWMMQRSPTSR